MEFRLLGPFEAVHDGREVPVGRRQERIVLAALLLAPGHIVAVDRLIDLLWPEDPPASARATLHTYLGRVRRVLRPYGPRVEHRSGSYRLERSGAVDVDVDVDAFRRLAAAAAVATDPAEQVRLGGDALRLWRADLLSGLLPAERGEQLGAGLTDLRLATAERYARVRLDAGEHELVVSELLPLARRHPSREGLSALLMTALYRCSRRTDALRLFADAARALDGLGVTVGPALVLLRDRIDTDDPVLSRPPGPVYAVRVRDQWLPWNTSGHPALEFCNTYAGWGGPPQPGSDWLRSYRTLAVWAGYADLADDRVVTDLLGKADADPLAAADVLAEARELRRQLYACLTDPGDAAAFRAVAAAAEQSARVSSFVQDTDGLGRWRVSPRAGLRLPVHGAARCAADLLGDPRWRTIRACPAQDCGWLFLDAAGRRRWCSLGTCGRSAACR